ncbi:hypothetical protein R80B4_01870 [Fibrobacteres bacterium R8-0-B4]
MLPDYNPEDLARYRIDKAKSCLQGAESEIANNRFENSANRSYYCIFNAMRAVLALDQFDSKKHSGIISAFRKNYLKTGIFPVTFSDTIANAFEVRNESDYNDFYFVLKEKVITQANNAKTFLDAVEKYVGERILNTRDANQTPTH